VERPGDYEAFIAIDFILINQIIKGLYDATTIPHRLLLSQFVTPETTKTILEETDKFLSGLPVNQEQLSLGELQILSTPIVSAVIIDTPSVTLNVQIPFNLEIIELITHITHVDKNVVTFLKGTLSATVRVHTKQREGFFFEIVQEGTSLVRLAIDADSKMQLRTISEDSLNLALSVIIKLFVPFKILDVEVFKLQDDNSLKLIFTRIQVLTFSISWINSISKKIRAIDRFIDLNPNLHEIIDITPAIFIKNIDSMCENRKTIGQTLNLGFRITDLNPSQINPTFIDNLKNGMIEILASENFYFRVNKKLFDILLISIDPDIITRIIQIKADQSDAVVNSVGFNFLISNINDNKSTEIFSLEITLRITDKLPIVHTSFIIHQKIVLNISSPNHDNNKLGIIQAQSSPDFPGSVVFLGFVSEFFSGLLKDLVFNILDQIPDEKRPDRFAIRLPSIPQTELLPRILQFSTSSVGETLECSLDLSLGADNINTHVYVQFFKRTAFPISAEPVPIQFAKVVLFDQDTPNPPNDDVKVPKNKEHEVIKTGKFTTTTTTTFIPPTTDQKLAEATTNLNGIAHFILPPFGNTAGKLRIFTSTVQNQPQGRPPHRTGSDGLPIEVDVNEPEVTETEAFVEESFPDLYFILQSTNQAGNVVRTLDSRHISGPGLLVNQDDVGNRRIGSADKPIKFIFEEAPKTHE
jgi:hypothetical protein